jgi:hypothetical protein
MDEGFFTSRLSSFHNQVAIGKKKNEIACIFSLENGPGDLGSHDFLTCIGYVSELGLVPGPLDTEMLCYS